MEPMSDGEKLQAVLELQARSRISSVLRASIRRLDRWEVEANNFGVMADDAAVVYNKYARELEGLEQQAANELAGCNELIEVLATEWICERELNKG